MEATKIEGRSLIHILRDPSSPIGDPFINYLKSIIGEKTSMTTSTGVITYSPYPCKVKISERVNLSNKEYKIYMGVEKVSFRSDHCKGSFVHDGPLLISMICNGPNKGILRNLLVSVATYCRFNYENTRSRYPSTMHKEAAQLNKSSIHNFLRVSE